MNRHYWRFPPVFCYYPLCIYKYIANFANVNYNFSSLLFYIM
jgi:hypothetical protein